MTYYQTQVAKLNDELYSSESVWTRIRAAKKFIDEQYGESQDLERISDQASMTKFHFIRLFKAYYGQTPHQYLTWVRIGAAKKMLNNGSTVTVTSAAVGFESVTSFATLFKKLTGTSPSTTRLVPKS